MQIFSPAALRLGAIAALCIVNVAMYRAPQSEPPAPFESGIAAFRAGEQALAADHKAAVEAFEAAAAQGVLGAQLRLARLYRGTSGFERDDAKSLKYYQMLADQNADIDPLHPAAVFVAEAFREMAAIYLTGSETIQLAPMPKRAVRLLLYAASYLRDPRAQFALARLYIDGVGVARNERLAIRWLMNAARKKYAPAQAYLGELLWKVQGSAALRARGLALLAIAADNADAHDRAWIVQIYQTMAAQAQQAEVAVATRLLSGWEGLRMRVNEISIATGATKLATGQSDAAKSEIVDASLAEAAIDGAILVSGEARQSGPKIGSGDASAPDTGKSSLTQLETPSPSNGLPVLSVSLSPSGVGAPPRDGPRALTSGKPYAEVDIGLYYGDTQQFNLGHVDRAIAIGMEQLQAQE